MEYIKYIIDNWEIFLALICIVIVSIQKIWEFIGYPTEKKKEEIKNRLLEWVRSAEASLGSETGKFKLSQVYDLFCEKYPYVKKWFTLEEFDALVGSALEEMNKSFENPVVKENALQK